MAETYDHDIPAWMDGTESLSDGEYRAYHVVCQMIYLQDGPIVANEKGIAGRCNQHILAFRRHLASLIAKGKLRLADGKITNRRAETEIAQGIRRRTPRQPPADPQPTPGQPPPNPPATPVQPPRGLGHKPLKTNKPTENEQNPGARAPASLPSLRLSLSESKGVSELELFQTQNLVGNSEEKASGNLRIWDFEAFWRQYPHKVGKGQARRAFDAAMRKKGVTFDQVMLGLMRYAAKTDDRPWCNPATFLNGERWLDEPATTGGTNGGKGEGSLLDAFERVSGLVEDAEANALRDGPVRRLPAGQVR